MGAARIRSAAAMAAVLAAVAMGQRGAAEIGFEATWQPPAYETVRKEIMDWVKDAKLDESEVEKIRKQWPERAPKDAVSGDLLDRAAKSFAVAYPEAAKLVEQCGSGYEGPAAPKAEWLASSELPEFARHNLRLYYARWLAQYGLYDEVLEQIGEVNPRDVVDPASLLFYQMAAHHQLVQPEEARTALIQLMEHEDALPRRFLQVAQLVEKDLSSLEDESLDHIARRMRDIRRRLDYGRAGEKVQKIEDGVVKSLDKKIEEAEKQQQQQQSAAAQGGSQQSSRPMQDSQLPSLKAPMQVDRRDIGRKSGWGDLPPKEREQALQQIGREFPAHYRELIEQYFRELANEETNAGRAAAPPASK